MHEIFLALYSLFTSNRQRYNLPLAFDLLEAIGNAEKRAASQTATDKFYPHFVGLLKDGRYLAVEYKGADLMSTDDTKEKRMVSELWEARSGSRCVFRLVGLNNMEQAILQAAS